jgi:hypothetical protein
VLQNDAKDSSVHQLVCDLLKTYGVEHRLEDVDAEASELLPTSNLPLLYFRSMFVGSFRSVLWG